MLSVSASLLAALAAWSSLGAAQGAGAGPMVDLGYSMVQGQPLLPGSVAFKNIRYAAPPVGQLRWMPPQPPMNETSVNNGSVGNICYQATPSWLTLLTEAEAQLSNSSSSSNATAAKVPPQSEDCLFLDVYAPSSALNSSSNSTGKLPVMVWIYGGGYTEGYKDTYSGIPFLQSSNNSVIFVALNYRLGAFGFLAGSTVERNGTGVANAGLLDQRAALKWVQKYISKFGGDPGQVTVMGESAGGGSIMHQITAYRGSEKSPFQRAIIQSPGFQPLTSRAYIDQQFMNFSMAANCSSLACLRGASSAALQMANLNVVLPSSWGLFYFGPTVDDNFTTSLPGVALAAGQFDRSVQIMSGHNANEGQIFSSPYVTTNAEFNSTVEQILNAYNPRVLSHIDQLYPPPNMTAGMGSNMTSSSSNSSSSSSSVTFQQVFQEFVAALYVPDNSTALYTNNYERLRLVSTEAIFTCNTYYLAAAKNNQSYNYEFAVFPALHGDDVAYTFYTPLVPSMTNSKVANMMQQYFINFAKSGNPNMASNSSSGMMSGNMSLPYFPMYGANSTVLMLNTTTSLVKDWNNNPRCDFWQKAEYA